MSGRTTGRELPAEVDGPVPGDPWEGPQGLDRWRLLPSGTMTRMSDGRLLSDLVGGEGAQEQVARLLAIKPSGGRVWVDDDGRAVATNHGRPTYLGRLDGVTAPTALAAQGTDPARRAGASGSALPTDPGNGPLAESVARALADAPHSSAREIALWLKTHAGTVATKVEVNAVLYGDDGTFARDGSSAPRWRLSTTAPAEDTPRGEGRPGEPALSPRAARAEQDRAAYAALVADSPVVPPPPPRPTAASRPAPPQELGLMPWQQEAVALWYANGCEGIVEAVTGTGKTHVGLEAVAHAARAGERSTVLVPTIDLQDQWVRRFADFLPHLTVATLGGTGRGRPQRADVTIAVVHSATKTDLSASSGGSLLVADEVHRYGADSYQLALRAGYTRRLGLTATLERSDDAIGGVLAPYFGRTILSVGFDRAVRERVVAPFRLVMAPVSMSDEERAAYEALGQKISDGLTTLRAAGALQGGGDIAQHLARLSGIPGRLGFAARSASSAMRERRTHLAELEGKLDAVEELAEAVRASQGAVLFTQSTTTAEEAARRLRSWDVSASAMHSGMNHTERVDAIAALRSGRLHALAAPKLLDEGIDLPTVDLGIVMTASRSRRQMVQRLGRVIRKKEDGRPVDFVILYASETVEDPESGAHEGFFDLVGEVAATTLVLELGWSADELAE